jgi:hypothetical protein
MFQLRTETLRDAQSFVEYWNEIELLRMKLGLEHDVLVAPAHFLTTLDATRRSCSVACWLHEQLLGIVYATEFSLRGLWTGYAVGGDFAGRGLLLCAEELETAVLEAAILHMTSHGIHALHLRLLPRMTDHSTLPGIAMQYLDGLIPGDRMTLAPDFDLFLAGLGRHTRRNIRHYMRKVASIGISFVALLTEEEYQSAVHRLNSDSSFRANVSRLARDERLLALHSGAQRVGLQAANGDFVAVLCGFTSGTRFHLLTQLNDVKLEQLSLSLVLRGLLIKHLIASGHTELQFMGGASLSLGRFCAPENYRSIFADKTVGAAAIMKRLIYRGLTLLDMFDVSPHRASTALCNGYLENARLRERTALAHAALVFSVEAKQQEVGRERKLT